MNAQDLKNSILQLAVQGELVEQRAEEGTARELLEQIKAEKEQLIKDKKIKKSKPLPEITEDEIPFEIPESWEWVRLEEALDIARGASPRPIRNYVTTSKNGINWIKIGDTEKGGKYINSTAERITLEGKQKSRFVKKGSFLLSNSMSFGRPYILNIDGCIHDGWLVLNQRVHMFGQDYLYYLLSSKMVYYQFCNKASGAVVNNLNSDKVRETIVPLPPLEEQHRIVAKIEEMIPYIDQYDKAYTKLETLNKKFPEAMKKSILQMAIQGKLVKQRPEEGTADELYERIISEKTQLIKDGKIKKEKPLPEIAEDEIPFEIPNSWRWVRFGEFGNYKKGPFGSALTKAIFVPKGDDTVKVYEQKNAIQKDASLGEYYITRDYFESKMQGFELFPGDIIVSCAGTIGETYIMPEGIEQGIINQALMRMRLMPSVYVKYFLIYFDVILKQTARKSSKGSAIKNIPPLKALKSYLVPLPPLEEQKRIVAKIEEILPYCEQLINVDK